LITIIMLIISSSYSKCRMLFIVVEQNHYPYNCYNYHIGIAFHWLQNYHWTPQQLLKWKWRLEKIL